MTRKSNTDSKMLILKYKVRLPNYHNDGLALDSKWNPDLQLWVDARTGRPIIDGYAVSGTNYGETLMTNTIEGIDQTESADLTSNMTPYGETIFTKTAEGVDQTEVSSCASLASNLGETIHTFTQEGIDQSEGTEHAANYYE